MFRGQIRSEIDIEAPPERVWEVLTDLPAHKEWDPFLVEAEGRVEEGARLRVVMRPEGAKRPTTFRPTVTTVEPGTEFRWLGRLWGIPGLFDGEHRFQLRDAGGRTQLVQEERFSGALVPLLIGWVRRTTLPAFEASNRALKQRVENTPG